jgi:hypothetical protein
MGRTGKCLRILVAAVLSGAAALYCGDTAAQSVSPTMPPPNRNITAPAPQRQTAPSPRANPLPGAKAPQPILRAAGDGVIAGYVWWDGNTTSHIPANNCSGLSITVSAGSPSQSSPTLEQFTPIGTYTNNFSYVPNIGTDGVCAFAVHQMPVGQDLQVKLDVNTATAFSPVSAPAVAITPIKIINGKCNNLPPAVPSPSVLTSNWWTCGNYAYNVNFALRPSAHIMSSGGGTGNTPASPNARQGLLSNSVPRGMLNGGTAPSGAGGVPAGQSQGGGMQNPGSKVALNPQPLPPGQKLSNADVIKMANGRVPESVILSSVQSSRGNFDLSPSGCNSLRQAQVSERVLNAMGDGSVRPCAAGGAASGDRARKLAKSLQLKSGRNVKIAGVAPAIDPAVLETLKAQSAAAHKEKLAPPAKIQASTGGTSAPRALATNARTNQLLSTSGATQIGPGHTMGSGTDPATGGSGTDPTTGASDPAGTPSGGSQPGSTPDGGTPLQQTGNPPTQPGSSGQNSLSIMERAKYAPQPISMCRFTTDPVVETVSGRQHTIVLTPDPGNGQYPANQYTIRGCNFGSVQGKVQVYGPFINNPTPVQLGIDSWDDNQILVTFNPKFQNEYDLNSNLTLAVVRTDGHNAKIPNVSFYATRVSRSLSRIPQSLVKLPTTFLEIDAYVSPVTGQALKAWSLTPPSQPASAVFWVFDPIWTSNAGDGYPPNRLSFGDSIDFSQLRPGFTLDPNLQTIVGKYYPDLSGNGLDTGSCKYMDVVVGANMQGSNLLVGVQPAECDNYGKFIYAYYGLQLSVTGPKGDLLDPWPGNLQ